MYDNNYENTPVPWRLWHRPTLRPHKHMWKVLNAHIQRVNTPTITMSTYLAIYNPQLSAKFKQYATHNNASYYAFHIGT